MFIQLYQEKYMRFPCGRAKAATFSYDDGVEADKRLIATFDKYGLKGTFNLNTKLFDAACWHSRMDEETAYRTFANCGHELANHGARHVFLDKVSLAEAAKEIIDCRSYMEKKYQRIVRGLAYAYSGYNLQILSLLPALGIDYARTTASTHSFALPENWLEWHPTCKHTDPELFALCDKFLSGSPEDLPKHREPWLFYVWGHSFEFDDDGNWDVIEKLGEKLCGRQDVWFATNGEIFDYVKAYQSLVFSADGERAYNPSSRAVYIEIRKKIYEIGAGESVVFDAPAE